MYWYSRIEDIPPEIVEETIDKVANLLVERGVGSVASFILEVNFPFVYIYGELGRFFMTPIFSILSRDDEETFHNHITIFEQRKNIRRLIQRIKEIEEEINKNKNDTSKFNHIKSWFKNNIFVKS